MDQDRHAHPLPPSLSRPKGAVSRIKGAASRTMGAVQSPADGAAAPRPDRRRGIGSRLPPLPRLVRRDPLILGALAVAVGALVGCGILAFRETIALVQTLAFGSDTEYLASHVRDLPAWQIVTGPLAGGVVVGLLYRLLMPGGGPQGVAHVIEAVAVRDGRMDGRGGLVAAIGSAVSLGFGASVGREGPAVHLGATLGSVIGQRLGLGRRLVRTLLGCGVAAGVAASFNAPIAGALFASEVVIGHYALFSFAPVVVASVTATVVTRAWFGDFPVLELPGVGAVGPWELPVVLGVGLVSGLVAILFSRGVMASTVAARRVALPPPLGPMLAGGATGLLALAVPEVLGVGFEATDQALKGGYEASALLAIAAAKLVATALCLGWGFGGGVFSPSLTLGALVGAAYGALAAGLLPDLVADPGAYGLMGMGAVAAAVLGAPISTTLIVFELTGDYGLTVWMMTAVVLATAVSRQGLGAPSLFHLQCAAAGVALEDPQERDLLETTRVEAVRLLPCLIDDRTGPPRPADGGRPGRGDGPLSPPPAWVLRVDAAGRYLGCRPAAAKTQGVDGPTAAGAQRPAVEDADRDGIDPPVVFAHDTLDAVLVVLRQGAEAGYPAAVVLSDPDHRRPLGLVRQDDVARACLRRLTNGGAPGDGPGRGERTRPD